MNEKYFLNAKQYGESNNIVVEDVFLKGKSIYVKGVDKNQDRFGNEYGNFTQLYYSFIKGRKRKNIISDDLAKSTEEWISEMKNIHPEYDYSVTEYINNRVAVKIKCVKHGIFSVMPKVFAKKDYCCASCKKEKSIQQKYMQIYETLKASCPEYEFDMSTYRNKKSKIKITCPEHGEFWQSVKTFLVNKTCPKCMYENNAKKRRTTLDEFIRRGQDVHDNKYDYSKVHYVNNNTKVCIICPEHGEFWQTPVAHLRSKGCPKCSNVYMRTQNEFIADAKKIHGNKYDYSKVEYINMTTKVCIICPKHGEFWQTPKLHLNGYGCKKCSNKFLDKDFFILKSCILHGDKYDYSKVHYINSKTKVCIICPEHGEFWQEPSSHLNGRGCPLCKTSHLEREMKQFLDDNNINYIYQYHNKDIFGRQSLDFYLPEYNIAIECQGEQHYIANFFKSKGMEYAERHLEYIQELDKKKNAIAKKNNITILYYLNKKFLKFIGEEISNCYSNKNELLNRIIKKVD